MSIKRNLPRSHINARNYTFDAANKRSEELEKGRQIHQQNSLKVNSPPVVYYQQVKAGYTCTCHTSSRPNGDLALIDDQRVEPEAEGSAFGPKTDVYTIDLKNPLFGSTHQMVGEEPYRLVDVEDDLVDDEEVSEDKVAMFPDLFAKGTDCGICYRTGYAPLWNPIGRQRVSLTTHVAKTLDGFYVNQSTSPAVFERTDRTGFVEFMLQIPKYFQAVTYAVYNNTIRLPDLIEYQDQPINLTTLREHAGSKIPIQVRAETFTHVVLEFDLGVILQANFPQLTATRDYNYFFNLASVSIELPPSICNPQISDVIYVPQWKRLWQIYDVAPYVMPSGTLIKTTAQGRLIAQIETLHNLADLFPLK